MTLAAVRALAWLQWRLFVNGLRGGRRRDTLERASRWLDVLTPVVKAVFVIPLSVLLVALGAVAGYRLGRGADPISAVELVIAIVLAFPLAFVALRPIFLAGRGFLERSDLVRLLPIRRSLLFNLEFARAAADPTILLFAPPLIVLPCGALAAGAGRLAVVALAAGLAYLLVLVGIGGFVVIAAQLFLRDRRRAEAAALVLGVGVLLLNLAPQLFIERHPSGRSARAGEPPRSAPVHPESGEFPVALRYLPSSVFATAVGEAASGQVLASAGRVGVLVVVAAGFYVLATPLQRRLLETPARSTRRAGAARAETWTLPFVSRATAAVALVEVRTVLRTVRGRMGLLMAPLFGAFFVIAFQGVPGGAPAPVFGRPLAAMVIILVVSLQSLAPVSANQFASDGGGLPLLFLEPVPTRTLVLGKALGLGILQAACLVLALAAFAVVARSADAALVLAALLAGLAALIALVPVAAAVSALFPKRVDLGRWGRSSNPHQTAGLVNFFTSGLMVVPFAGAVLLSSLVLHRPWVAPLLMAGWLAITCVATALLLPVAGRIVARRRENLVLVVLTD